VNRLDVIDFRVRKCRDIIIIIDKKIREDRIEYEKYVIPLSGSNPFESDEFVKILRKSDFEKKIENILKSRPKENN